MSKLWWIVIALVVLGGGIYFYSKKPVVMPTTVPVTEEPAPETTTEEQAAPQTTMVEVSYMDDGFQPSMIEIQKGDTVKFTNKSSRKMWVASDVHPTHSVYPEFDQKMAVDAGGTYSFTFDKVGSWTYHNHMFASSTGTVVVKDASSGATLDTNLDTNIKVTY